MATPTARHATRPPEARHSTGSGADARALGDGRSRQLGARLALAWIFALALLTPLAAHADDVTGSWTGAVEGHLNYFLERSTRIVMPEVTLELESPAGVDMEVEYLVDVISSASIAQTGSDEDDVFHEYRQQGSARLGYEVDVGAPLRLQTGFTYSSEDDYTSRNYLFGAALSLFEYNTVLALTGGFTDDTVLSNADTTFEGSKQALTLNPSIEQVLGPTLMLNVGYSISMLDGFLANPYRRALKGPLPFPEDHPRERTRHAAYAKLRWFIPQTNTALHLAHRVYVDSWDIGALNPWLKVIQEIASGVLVTAQYRFYIQNSAFFYRSSYAREYDGFITNDPKMAAHETHVVGGRIDLPLSLLEMTPLGFLSQGSVILTYDRYYNTNAFGDGHIATAGGRLPF